MSKRKLYFKRTIKIASLILAIALVTAFCQQYLLCHFDYNKLLMNGFYLEDKNSLDVVLIGASETYTDFSPDLAYEEYGFTSYPVATGAAPVSLIKTQLKEVLRTQSPKLIVIEINGVLYRGKDSLTKESNLRKSLDNMPLNANKIEYINNHIAISDQFEYYLPITKYHSVWNDYPEPLKYVKGLFAQNFRGYTYLKGVRTQGNVYDTKQVKMLNATLPKDENRENLEETSEADFRDLLQYIKDEKLDNIIFMRLPHIVAKSENYGRYKRCNTAGDIISEYGFDFYNFERYNDDIGIDFTKDYYNVDHMNVEGQQKMTRYLSELFVNKYGITPTELTEKQKEKWDTCADYYHKYVEYVKYVAKKDPKAKEVGEDGNTLAKIAKLSKSK